jgi:hypothetical protein
MLGDAQRAGEAQRRQVHRPFVGAVLPGVRASGVVRLAAV